MLQLKKFPQPYAAAGIRTCISWVAPTKDLLKTSLLTELPHLTCRTMLESPYQNNLGASIFEPRSTGWKVQTYLWAMLLPIQNCLSLLIKIRKCRRLAFPFFVLTHLNLPLIYIFPKFESSSEENTQKSFLLNFQFIPKVKFYAWAAIVAQR